MSTQKTTHKLKEGYGTLELLENIVYPQQFKSEKQLLFHVVNCCSPHFPAEAVKKIAHKFLPNCENKTIWDTLSAYAPDYGRSTTPKCFTKVLSAVPEEDLVFVQGKKTHRVRRSELAYILSRIVNKIWKTHNKVVPLAQSYFVGTGRKKQDSKDRFADSYRAETGYALWTNKLSHVLRVLQKHELLHVSQDKFGSRLGYFRIGSKNPYYCLCEIPAVPEVIEDHRTTVEKRMEQMQSDLHMLSDALQSAKIEGKEKDAQVEELTDRVQTLSTELEHTKQVNVRLDEILQEMEEAGKSCSTCDGAAGAEVLPEEKECICKLEEAVAAQNAAIHEKDSTIGELKQQIKMLEAELRRVNDLLSAVCQKYEESRTETLLNGACE